MFIWWERLLLSRLKIFLWLIRSVLTRIILLKIFCWITCSLWIFTIVPKSCILIRMCAESYLLLRPTATGNQNALEMVRSIYSSKTKDFITAVDEKSVILVKEVAPGEGYEELCKSAKGLKDMLSGENLPDVRVALGTIVTEIKDVSRSYKEAKMALDVGKIFYSERSVVAYSNLGIGRLIYQLPIPLCKMFIQGNL